MATPIDMRRLLKLLPQRISENLSILINDTIQMKIDKYCRVKPEEIIERLGRNKPIVAVYSRLIGYNNKEDIGHVVILLELDNARSLATMLLSIAEIDVEEEVAIDALREFGNIIVGNIVALIASCINKAVNYSIPEVVIDTDIAILDSIITPIAFNYDYIDLVMLNVYTLSNLVSSLQLLYCIGGHA